MNDERPIDPDIAGIVAEIVADDPGIYSRDDLDNLQFAIAQFVVQSTSYAEKEDQASN